MPSAELQEAHLAVLRGEVAAPRHEGNLPAARTSFVGREADLQRAGDLLARHRLVTLVGTGGAGKTRLAVELAARTPGTAWLVELASLGDADGLAPAVLGALGLREAALPDRPAAAADAESRLIDALAVSDALLVLDNCEHIVVAVAELADRLLAGCPRLRILATSREPLGIGGEALAPVGPLEEESAVLLFAQRAASATPSFALDETTAPVVADVCRRIDGLPLAIELAAARLRSMPLQELADRLHDRFRLLTGGSRAAAGRQRTLRAVVDWSWDLLREPERRLARRLSVFGAGATLDAVEEVCAGDGVAAEDVFDLLCALVDRSLLGIADEGATRWRMLETIREYAEEEAERAGELRALREAHAAHYAAFVVEADDHLRGPEQLTWLARLRADRDNVLAAARFLGETGEGGRALRMAIGLLWFWALDGGRDDALTWLRFGLTSDGARRSTRRAAVARGRRLDRPEPCSHGPVGGDASGRSSCLQGADLDDRPLLALVAPVVALFIGEEARGRAMLDDLGLAPGRVGAARWCRSPGADRRERGRARRDGRAHGASRSSASARSATAGGIAARAVGARLAAHARRRARHRGGRARARRDAAAGRARVADPRAAMIAHAPRGAAHPARRPRGRTGDDRRGAGGRRRAGGAPDAHDPPRRGHGRTGNRAAARALRDEALRGVAEDGETRRPDHGHQRAIVVRVRRARCRPRTASSTSPTRSSARPTSRRSGRDDLPIAGRVGESDARCSRCGSAVPAGGRDARRVRCACAEPTTREPGDRRDPRRAARRRWATTRRRGRRGRPGAGPRGGHGPGRPRRR